MTAPLVNIPLSGTASWPCGDLSAPPSLLDQHHQTQVRAHNHLPQRHNKNFRFPGWVCKQQ